MNFLFIDSETFGQDVDDCAIIDFSAMVVDTDKFLSNDPYTTKDIENVKRFKLSVKEQVDKYGYKVYSDTIKFWEKQDTEVRKKITPKKNDLTLDQFVNDFITYLANNNKIDRWWSRSNTFDPILLQRVFKSTNKIARMHEYLKYWQVRDIRTFIDAKLDFPKVNGFVPIEDEEYWKVTFKEHMSDWDVLADILRLQAIYRVENEMENIKR